MVMVLLGWDLQRGAAIAGVVGVVVACYALVLMFLPATNRYIHLVEVARMGEARRERGGTNRAGHGVVMVAGGRNRVGVGRMVSGTGEFVTQRSEESVSR